MAFAPTSPNPSQTLFAPLAGETSAKINMKIQLVLCTLLTTCSWAKAGEKATFHIGPDSFNTSSGIFERDLCSKDQESIKVRIQLDDNSKSEMIRLAKLDVLEGNKNSVDLETICVSSFPYEISVYESSEVSTTCLSILNSYESRFEGAVQSLSEVKNLPKSACRFY